MITVRTNRTRASDPRFRPPPEIEAMEYRACPICGADGMQDVTPRGGVMQKFYCKKCRNMNYTAVPSAEQQERARRVFSPWME